MTKLDLSAALTLALAKSMKYAEDPPRDGRVAPKGWPTIATAPADGSMITVVSISRMGELYDPPRPFTAFWKPAGDSYVRSEDGWVRQAYDNGRVINHVSYPTHWSGQVLDGPSFGRWPPKTYDMHDGYGHCGGTGRVWVDDGEASNFYGGGNCPKCDP